MGVQLRTSSEMISASIVDRVRVRDMQPSKMCHAARHPQHYQEPLRPWTNFVNESAVLLITPDHKSPFKLNMVLLGSPTDGTTHPRSRSTLRQVDSKSVKGFSIMPAAKCANWLRDVLPRMCEMCSR